MKSKHLASCLPLAITATALADPALEAPADLWSCARPDSHAPIGVMADHTHHAGEWMLSFRHMYMHMDGNRSGTGSLSTSDVFAEGFTVAPRDMDMHMNMIGVMHAPTDWLTLALMTSYNFARMEMEAAPPAPAAMGMHGHGAGHAMGHGMGHGTGHGAGHGSGHGMGHGGDRVFSHASEGWGDTTLTAIVPVLSAHRQALHVSLGLGFPTASVSESENGAILPYGMQLGRGLWDFRPGLTYLGQTDHLSWGAQGSAVIGLDDENNAGYAPGDVFRATAWLAAKICDCASVSGRVNFTRQDGWDGHYNAPHSHDSPPFVISNFGGDVVELGVGLNLFQGAGRFAGNRLAIEALFPVYQDARGIQLERDFTLTFGWQFAF